MAKSQKTANMLPLREFSKILSSRLGRNVTITSAEKVSSGFLSDGFKLTLKDGKEYFVRRFKGNALSGDIAEYQLFDYVVSNAMMRRGGSKDKGMCVVVGERGSLMAVPDISKTSDIYHIQPYKKLPEKNYWTHLNERVEKKGLDQMDREEVALKVNLLRKLHSGPIETKFPKERYNISLQSIFSSLFFMILHSLPEKHPLLPHDRHGEYMEKMMSVIHEYKDRHDRLRTLHGDFWGGNIFIDVENAEAHAVDFSRLPYGDPAVDVASWIGQYLWLYHATQNPYYKKLGELFLREYEKVSKDHELRQIMVLPLAVMGLVYLSEELYPDFDMESRRRFFSAVEKSLSAKKFSWE